jgi:hypothetical protein
MPWKAGKQIVFFEAVYVCDACGEGEVTYTGNDNTESGDKTFEHVCSECEEIAWLFRIFPATAQSPLRIMHDPSVAKTDNGKKPKGRRRKRKKLQGA